ncbi:MAG TPA: DUF3443 domain-containing protein [Burkholderiales bacterium]|nr:DUF3443 domain-containing protein [Burkholderiales bacterium]
MLSIPGCGGGGGGSSTPAGKQGPNVAGIVVESGPTANVNLLFTTVTVCAPGTSRCQSIDHVLVDTGSVGLRLLNSVLSSSLALPQSTSGGTPVVECGQFAAGFTWGPVKLADVKMASETAANIPIQVVADPAFSTIPAGCSNTGASIDTVATMGANGILGLDVFRQDCGTGCAQSALNIYFLCPSSTCTATALPLAQQLQNPVGHFAVNNNGFVIDLPAIAAAGASRVDGTLAFGIGTQGNNGLGSARILDVDPATATFTTVVNGTTYAHSFMDSGSNAYFFSSGIAVCGSSADFYCPASTQTFNATNRGPGGTNIPVSFQVANAESLFAGRPFAFAYNNLAGTDPVNATFDWGLPFFFGRSVFLALDGAATPGGSGPYLAF